MKNKLLDLNDYLFAQLERLNDKELKADDLREEIVRADTICRVSCQIISTQSLVLKAYAAMDDSISCVNVPEIKKIIGYDKKDC